MRSVADDVASSCKSAGVYAAMDLETGIEYSVKRVVRRMQKKVMASEEFALIEVRQASERKSGATASRNFGSSSDS